MVILEILIVGAVLAAIGYPLFSRAALAGAEGIEEGDNYHRLLYAKDATYLALKDLEFDYRTGKMDEDDYRELKAKFEGEAVEILKNIDQMEKGESIPPAKGKNEAYCGGCGEKAHQGDKFCRSCGKKLG